MKGAVFNIFEKQKLLLKENSSVKVIHTYVIHTIFPRERREDRCAVIIDHPIEKYISR